MSDSDFKRTSLKTELTEDDIGFIMSNTDLDRERIIKWFDQFKLQCPEYRLDKRSFIEFYKKLVPGDSGYDEERFCECVFQAFDTDNNGYVDFGEFLISFWIRAKGSLKEKLSWLFDVYDTDRSNYISQWELARTLKLIFSIKNVQEDSYERTTKIMDSIDRSHDGRLTKAEFIFGCTKDEKLRELLAPF